MVVFRGRHVLRSMKRKPPPRERRSSTLIDRSSGTAIDHISELQKDELHSCFQFFDKDNSGYLCAEPTSPRAHPHLLHRCARTPPQRAADETHARRSMLDACVHAIPLAHASCACSRVLAGTGWR